MFYGAQQRDDPEIYPVNAAEDEVNELKAKIEALEIQNRRLGRIVYPDSPDTTLDVAEANAIDPESRSISRPSHLYSERSNVLAEAVDAKLE